MRHLAAGIALTIALAACGSRTASAPEAMPTPAAPTVTPYQTMTPTPIPTTAAPTPTPTPGPTLSSATAEKYFHPLAGYELCVPLPEVGTQLPELVSAPELTSIATGVALRLVTRNGDSANMAVLSLSLLPSYAALPAVLDEFAAGYSQAGSSASCSPATQRCITRRRRRALCGPTARTSSSPTPAIAWRRPR